MGPEVVTLGESIGLLTQSADMPLIRQPTLRLGFGGAESNVAIGLARLGRAAHWIGRLGTDEVGALIARELRAEAVSTSIVRDPAPTGLMLKTRQASGRVQVGYYRTHSAGSRLAPADLDEALIAGARILHVTGITPALSASASDAVRRAVTIAEEHGVTVSFDANFRSRLWDEDRARPVLSHLLGKAGIFFATTEEALLFTDEKDPERQARAIAALGPGQVVIKLGSAGSVACVDGAVHRQRPQPVAVVDPVGAGDAFAAGYLNGVLDGADAAECLRIAGVCGARAVTVAGDWEGAPFAAELDDTGCDTDVVR
ncbi:sugar kinase [Streptomyces sp. NPDC014889]|uniref:sugar kinase n=1 Tax=Streptomyces sp. NPDC014889 TaxID=3364928 RepID=UPI0036FE5E35